MAENHPNSADNAMRNAVNSIDAIAQEGLSGIVAIARLVLMSLETPDGYRPSEVLADALLTIRNIADNTMACISSEAEGVGAAHRDTAQLRRWAAWDASRLVSTTNGATA